MNVGFEKPVKYGQKHNVIDALGVSNLLVKTADAPDSYTELLLHGLGSNGSTDFYDSSDNMNSPTNGGTSISTLLSPWAWSSLYFSGSASLKYSQAIQYIPSSTAFTIDFGVRFTLLPGSGNYAGICGSRGGSSDLWGIFIYNTGSGYECHLSFKGSGGSEEIKFTLDSLSDGTDYHFAVVKDSTSYYCFVGGVQQDTTKTSSNYPTTDDDFYIGRVRNYSDTYVYLTGYLWEFRYSNGVARYTADFTPRDCMYSSGYASLCIDITADAISLVNKEGKAVHFGQVSTELNLSKSGIGGLDTGKVDYTASGNVTTFYYIWLVSNGIDLQAVASLSYTDPTLSGWDYRRLISIACVNSYGIIPFWQMNEDYWYLSYLAAKYEGGEWTASTSWQSTDLRLYVPPGGLVKIIRMVYYDSIDADTGGTAVTYIGIYDHMGLNYYTQHWLYHRYYTSSGDYILQSNMSEDHIQYDQTYPYIQHKMSTTSGSHFYGYFCGFRFPI